MDKKLTPEQIKKKLADAGRIVWEDNSEAVSIIIGCDSLPKPPKRSENQS